MQFCPVEKTIKGLLVFLAKPLAKFFVKGLEKLNVLGFLAGKLQKGANAVILASSSAAELTRV